MTLAGDGLPESNWVLNAAAAAPARLPRFQEFWTLTVTGSNGACTVRSADSVASPDRLLDAFTSTLRGAPAGPAWNDLLRACEIVDAAQQWQARRRTIDLHFETTSERSQFKTQMTAVGCGVLFLTLLLMLAVMLIGSAVNVPPAIMQIAQGRGFRAAVLVPRHAAAHLHRAAPRRGLLTGLAACPVVEPGCRSFPLFRRNSP